MPNSNRYTAYSPFIYSDDGTLYGRVEYGVANGTSYIARIYQTATWYQDQGAGMIKAFGNGVAAEDWLLDRLECPIFTILSK